jgi:hypothetical protein
VQIGTDGSADPPQDSGSFLLAQQFGASGVYLCRKKEDTMLEIIVTVGLYLGALALLVKGAVTFCDICHE